MARQAPGQGIVNYISVESVADYVAKAEKLGAKVLMPKSAVPGMGWFAQLLDPEGNCFALWESDESAA
jgi:predicted enzyme related to lactoylglutathione lyase